MAGSDWGHQSWFQFESWRCHWRCTGAADRPALGLLHGFGASSGHWRDNAEAIAAAGYRVYATNASACDGGAGDCAHYAVSGADRV